MRRGKKGKGERERGRRRREGQTVRDRQTEKKHRGHVGDDQNDPHF